MGAIRFERVLSIPSTPTDDTLYFVTAGNEHIDLYIKGNTASPLRRMLTSRDIEAKITSLPTGLPSPDVHDTTSAYFYFGWTTVNGGWLVRRQDRTTGASVSADATQNASYTELSTAWAARATLNYT